MKKSTYKFNWVKAFTWICILVFCVCFWAFVISTAISLIWGN